MKYLKNNALAGRDGEALDTVNRALSKWVEEIAGTRVHGTTGKAPPLHDFQLEERLSLRALPEKPYEVVVWKKAPDALIANDRFFVRWRDRIASE